MHLASGQATATESIIFEAPPGGAWLGALYVRNTHTSAITFNLTSRGKQSSTSYGYGAVPKDYSINAGEAYRIPLGDDFGEGDTLRIDASVAAKLDYNLLGRLHNPQGMFRPAGQSQPSQPQVVPSGVSQPSTGAAA